MKFIFKLIITIILFFTFAYTVNLSKIISILSKVEIGFFVFILLLIFVSIFFNFLRFRYVFSKPFRKKLNNLEYFEIFITSISLSQMPIPGAQEVYKFFGLSKIFSNKEAVLSMVIIERFVGLVSNILLTIFLILLLINFIIYDKSYYFVYIVFVLLILAFFIFLILNISSFINRLPYISYLFQFFKFFYKNSRLYLMGIFLYSVFIQLLSIIISLFTISLFLEVNIQNIFYIIGFLQISNLVLAIPISLFGIGLRDWIYLTLFSYVINFPKEIIGSVSILINIGVLFSISFLLVLSYFIFFLKKLKKP